MYSVMESLGLTPKADLVARLNELTEKDCDLALDSMDAWYATNGETIRARIASDDMFTLWMPGMYATNAAEMTSRFVVADQVVSDDSFYDSLSILQTTRKGITLDENMHTLYLPPQMAAANMNAMVMRTAATIRLLWQCRELVESGNLLLYLDVRKRFNADDVRAGFDLVRALGHDDSEFAARMRKWRESWPTGAMDLDDSNAEESQRIFALFTEQIIRMAPMLMQIVATDIPARSVDLLDDSSADILDRAIRMVEKMPRQASILKPFSKSDVVIPSLAGTRLESVAEIRESANNAFLTLKATLAERTARMSAEPGTEDWEREVRSIRTQLQREVTDVQLSLNDIRRDHARRLTVELSLLAFSVTMTSIAQTAIGGDPLSTVNAVVGGAGMLASLRALASNWLSFRKDRSSVENRPAYFLWRLRNPASIAQ